MVRMTENLAYLVIQYPWWCLCVTLKQCSYDCTNCLQNFNLNVISCLGEAVCRFTYQTDWLFGAALYSFLFVSFSFFFQQLRKWNRWLVISGLATPTEILPLTSIATEWSPKLQVSNTALHNRKISNIF